DPGIEPHLRAAPCDEPDVRPVKPEARRQRDVVDLVHGAAAEGAHLEGDPPVEGGDVHARLVLLHLLRPEARVAEAYQIDGGLVLTVDEARGLLQSDVPHPW